MKILAILSLLALMIYSWSFVRNWEVDPEDESDDADGKYLEKSSPQGASGLYYARKMMNFGKRSGKR